MFIALSMVIPITNLHALFGVGICISQFPNRDEPHANLNMFCEHNKLTDL